MSKAGNNCIIGQREVCSKYGCQWKEQFGFSCKHIDVPADTSHIYAQRLEAYRGANVRHNESVDRRWEYKKNRKKRAVFTPTVSKRKLIWERSGGVCYLCGDHVKFEEYTIEHVVPLCRGGGNGLNNLRAAHYECNQKKGGKTAEELGIVPPPFIEATKLSA